MENEIVKLTKLLEKEHIDASVKDSIEKRLKILKDKESEVRK